MDVSVEEKINMMIASLSIAEESKREPVIKVMPKDFNENMERELENMDRELGRMGICEIYSPPRVATKASRYGLSAGWSLDLTQTDSDGCKWDFNIKAKREC